MSSDRANAGVAARVAFWLLLGCSNAARQANGAPGTLKPGFIAPAASAAAGGKAFVRTTTRCGGAITAASRRAKTLMTSSVTAAEGGDGGWGGVGVVGAEGVAAEGGDKGPTASSQDKLDATKSALLGVFGEEMASKGDASQEAGQEQPSGAADTVLACPSTLGALTEGFRSYGGVGPGAVSVSYLTADKRPGTRYKRGAVFTDFVEETRPAWRLSKAEAAKEGTFQSPLVSWLYERGWRQGFSANGFPGIDEEFRQANEFFVSTRAEDGTIMDVSCGSGLMTRKLVACKRYSRVIGGDLSATMLAETARRFKEDGLGRPELIRCDVSRLPLQTASLDGVHAGAALHCWSKLEEAISEVHRVLKPGKGFFATTFLTSATLRNSQQGRGFKFFELDELERLMLGAGFEEVEVSQSGRACAIVRATKGQ